MIESIEPTIPYDYITPGLIISVIFIIIGFIIIKLSSNRPTRLRTASAFIMIAIGTTLASISTVLLIVSPGNKYYEKYSAIVNTVEDKYGVELHTVQEEKDLTSILRGSPVGVTIEHDGQYYKDTYFVVYDENEDTAELVFTNHPGINDNPPTPEELENQARD